VGAGGPQACHQGDSGPDSLLLATHLWYPHPLILHSPIKPYLACLSILPCCWILGSVVVVRTNCVSSREGLGATELHSKAVMPSILLLVPYGQQASPAFFPMGGHTPLNPLLACHFILFQSKPMPPGHSWIRMERQARQGVKSSTPL
jgi:hypothetical protein